MPVASNRIKTCKTKININSPRGAWLEKKWLEWFSWRQCPECVVRTICMSQSIILRHMKFLHFFTETNNSDNIVKLAMEKGNKTINFLDLTILMNNNQLWKHMYRKSRHTDSIISNDSDHYYRHEVITLYGSSFMVNFTTFDINFSYTDLFTPIKTGINSLRQIATEAIYSSEQSNQVCVNRKFVSSQNLM